MAHIKLEHDLYEGRDSSWPITFGMKNFMGRDKQNYDVIHDLALSGKTIDGYDAELGYIIKPLSQIHIDADNFEGVYYNLEKPIMVDQDLKNKLLVWFSPFPDRFDAAAEMRMFCAEHQRWPDLSRRVANNTFILRLADSNLISGSFFQNTQTFPDYEEKIQQLIRKMAAENAVGSDNVVIYGDSRGGTGAFVHALLGGYQAVMLDPLMDRRTLDDGLIDSAIVQDFIPENFVARINGLLLNSTLSPDKIKVLSSDSLLGNYPFLVQLDVRKFTLLNLDYKMFVDYNGDRSHGVFVTGNFPLALQYLNEFLYAPDIKAVTEQIPDLYLDSRDWDARPIKLSRAYTFQYESDGLKILRSAYEAETSLLFHFKAVLDIGRKYHLEIISDQDLGHLCLVSNAKAEREDLELEEGQATFSARKHWTAIQFDNSKVAGWHAKIRAVKLVTLN
ncbi:MAG: XcbB/CpsF family capsular polysaccharide biosynthesis protein [Streptococcaceae bacterium]|jgi:hypothetical protein|nr:XcbB/CpsF family capsular polysaccharide biosynthesis protein [Streptococcaceae bacterium]